MYKKYTIKGVEYSIIKVSDGLYIPFDEGNTDYQKYLEWLEEGNEPLPSDEVLTQNEGTQQ